MNLIKGLLIALTVFGVSYAADLGVGRFEHVIDTTYMGADVRDTSTGTYLRNDMATSYWRAVRVQVDSLFGGDTVQVMTYARTSDVNRLIDSVEIVLEDTDSLYVYGGTLDPDSAYVGQELYAVLVNGFSVGSAAADSSLIGNRYDVELTYYLIPNY